MTIKWVEKQVPTSKYGFILFSVENVENVHYYYIFYNNSSIIFFCSPAPEQKDKLVSKATNQ